MKKNRTCAIVEDLLPSYLEELTNDTTKEMIEEHLKECKKCRAYKEELLAEKEEFLLQEEKKSAGFKKRLSRYRYQLLGLFLGMVLTVAAVFGSIIFAIAYYNRETQTEAHTENIQEYREFDDYYGISKLYLFPNATIKDKRGVEIKKYLYDCKGTKLFQDCQILLECEYSKEKYEEEKKRILGISDRETELFVKYTKEEYPYPAAYAMNGYETCYEYVLFLDEEQKMIYVYLQGGIDRRDLLFSEEYLPLEYGQNGMEFEAIGYNIYPIEEPFSEEE
ncbi:MAG: zf-HC2 domain-containing protein [Lachnospiraceae bacterium]|nr:zf-HC2 domain-containing protein [Lachnospiraceae bacterium]